MATTAHTALVLNHRRDPMRMKEPFRISGYLFDGIPAVIATLGDGRCQGRGEAAGVYYLRDDPDHMESEIERCRDAIEQGIDRLALQKLMPLGGARNALDCAFWELESFRKEQPVWKLAGVGPPCPLVTTFTLPAEDPAYLEARLPGFAHAKAIKLKLSGELAADTARVNPRISMLWWRCWLIIASACSSSRCVAVRRPRSPAGARPFRSRPMKASLVSKSWSASDICSR
jgi:hypothetical protein